MKKIFIIFVAIIAALVFNFNFGQTAAAKNEEPKLRIFVHYPKEPGKPTVLPMCTPTTNDQITDYGLAGWHMPTNGLTYKINYSNKPRNLTNAQFQTAITKSFNTWTAADVKQIFKYGGTTTVKTAKRDYANAIFFKAISGSAIAITYTWYYVSTGEVAEVDTAFNQSLAWSYTTPTGQDCVGLNSYDLQNIATHEFGHWVGLDDLYVNVDKDLTMYGYGDKGELKKDTLGRGDITGVNAILP